MKTSRDRVLDALNFRESDRVPIDMGAHRSSGIAAIAYAKLKEALGISSGGVYVYDVMQQLAIVEPPVLDALGIDTIEMGQTFLKDATDWQDWTLPDGTPCKIPAYVDARKVGEDWFIYNKKTGKARTVQRKGCLYFENVDYPFADCDLEDGVDPVYDLWASGALGASPPPGNHFGMNDPNLKTYARQAADFYKSTDRAVVGVFGGNLLETTEGLFGMENTFIQMSAYPDEYEELIERITQRHLQNLEIWLEAFGSSVDVILFGDDFGSQSAPLMSPEMYRRYFQPREKRMWELVHSRSKAKTNLHSCGSIEPLLNDLIDAGLDSVNPVQITCANMEPEKLKEKYKGRITFWGGGCDTRDILPHATPDQIREHVLRQCEILAPGGGFVFQQVHNIQADVPPENIIAMFEAARSFRL